MAPKQQELQQQQQRDLVVLDVNGVNGGKAHKGTPGDDVDGGDDADRLEARHAAIVARACAKLYRPMLPLAFIFSVVASLDRANLAYAALDMTADLGFSAETYGVGAAAFFVSYSLFQLPFNLALLRWGGPKVLGGVAIAWGVAAGAMAAVQGRASFIALRVVLGIFEAGTVPSMWAYLSLFFPGHHLTLATTWYMSGISAAQAIGAPLAAGLLTLHGAGGLPGWRWLFIIEAIPAVLLGAFMLLFLPAGVADCRRLLSSEERRHLVAELADPTHVDAAHGGAVASGAAAAAAAAAASGRGGGSRALSAEELMLRTPSESAALGPVSPRGPSSSGGGGARSAAGGAGAAGKVEQLPPTRAEIARDVAAALKSRVLWCASGWRFLYLAALNGLILWTPLVVASLFGSGNSSAKQQFASHSHSSVIVLLLTACPYVAGVSVHILNAMHSKRTRERRWHIAVCWLWGGVVLALIPAAWGSSGNGSGGSGSRGAAFALLVLAAAGVLGCDGLDVAWIIGLFGHTLTPSQTSMAMALLNSFSNIGGFVANYIIGAIKQHTGSFNGAMWLLSGFIVSAAACVAAFPLSWSEPASGCCWGGKSGAGQEGEEAAGSTKAAAAAAKTGDAAA